MNIRDANSFLILRCAGKLLLVTGIVGFILTFMYDHIVQRAWDLGGWQIVGLVYFAICV